MKRSLRIVDILNFVWASVHDFIYAAIVLALVWLWHQPSTFRNSVLLVAGVVAVFVVDAIVNYRQHRKLEKRIERLERRSHRRGVS